MENKGCEYTFCYVRGKPSKQLMGIMGEGTRILKEKKEFVEVGLFTIS